MTDDDWSRLLTESWRSLNDVLFGSGLRPPVIALDDSRTRLAGWRRHTRTITVSRSLLERPWPVVVEVLKHEMAHRIVRRVNLIINNQRILLIDLDLEPCNTITCTIVTSFNYKRARVILQTL